MAEDNATDAALENARKFLDLEVREVSLVDHAAIQRKFLVKKRLENGDTVSTDATLSSNETIVSLTKVMDGLQAAQIPGAEPAILFLSKILAGNMPITMTGETGQDSAVEKAKWSTAFINDLPDSSFLYIEDGGKKDEDGKTTPRSLRHFPVRDADGKIDLPHLRNALARIPQSNVSADAKEQATRTAERLLEESKKMETNKNEAGQQEGAQTTQASVQAPVAKTEAAPAAAGTDTGTAPAAAPAAPAAAPVQVSKQKAVADDVAVAVMNDGSVVVSGQQVTKGKAFTSSRTNTIKDAAHMLANLLKDVDPAALGEVLDSLKAQLPEGGSVGQQVVPQGTAGGVAMQQGTMNKSEGAAPAVTTEVAKAADQEPTWVSDIRKSVKGLEDKMATIEKARQPSTAAAQDGTDTNTTGVQKNFWGGVLA